MTATTDQIINSSFDWWTAISGVLGILGFIISLTTVLYSYATRKSRIEIELLESAIRPYVSKNRIILRIQFNNLSHLPVSITDFSILRNNKKYRVDDMTHEVLSYELKRNNQILERVPTYNTHIPVYIESLGSKSGYFVFLIPQDDFAETQSEFEVEVHTNRGLVSRTKISHNSPQELRRTFLGKNYKSQS